MSRGLYEDLVHTLAGLGLYLTLIVPADGNQCHSCWAILTYTCIYMYLPLHHPHTIQLENISYFTLSVES